MDDEFCQSRNRNTPGTTISTKHKSNDSLVDDHKYCLSDSSNDSVGYDEGSDYIDDMSSSSNVVCEAVDYFHYAEEDSDYCKSHRNDRDDSIKWSSVNGSYLTSYNTRNFFSQENNIWYGGFITRKSCLSCGFSFVPAIGIQSKNVNMFAWMQMVMIHN